MVLNLCYYQIFLFSKVNLISDPTPESEASQSLIAGIKAKADGFSMSMAGKRLVSETEWAKMQKEVTFEGNIDVVKLSHLESHTDYRNSKLWGIDFINLRVATTSIL